MRRLASLLFLLVLAVLVWLGARWFIHRGELHATVVLPSAGQLRRNDPVMEAGIQIGRVAGIARLDQEDAVSIRIARDYRRNIVADSFFEVAGTAPHVRLEVNNTVAVGAPVDDGAILHPRQDKVTRWLARHGSSVAPLIARLKQKTDRWLDTHSPDDLDQQLDDWKSRIPEWKKEGQATLERNLADARARIEEAESDLKKKGRFDEAAKLRKKFEAWWDDVTK
jgi:hypothetical protein